jgi:hypothetical protein
MHTSVTGQSIPPLQFQSTVTRRQKRRGRRLVPKVSKMKIARWLVNWKQRNPKIYTVNCDIYVF